MTEKDKAIKIIARNRKARHEYIILKKYEAGLVLTGTEVKSLRDGKVAMSDAFAVVRDGEIYLQHLDIPEYSHGNRMNHDPKRRRKLLFNKQEITRITIALKEKGLTLIPLAIYFKGGWAKLEMGLAKGKSLYDKRESMKKKDDHREMDRATGKRRQR
ncbi:MAG: SsrA-binding protein SmpB [Planctomycetota bacterium]|jgi:SsrA-binding protein